MLSAIIRGGSGRCCALLPDRRCDGHDTSILSGHIPRSSSGSVLRIYGAHPRSCVRSSYRGVLRRDNRSCCFYRVGCWPDGASSFSYFSVLEITFLPLSGEVRASPYVVVIYLDFQNTLYSIHGRPFLSTFPHSHSSQKLISRNLENGILPKVRIAAAT